MKKQIHLPEEITDLRIEEEDGYYHFWLDEKCVGYAWKTRTGFATADRPLENLIRAMTPFIQSFDQQIKWIDTLQEVELAQVVLLSNTETLLELQEHCNIYNEVLKLKALSTGLMSAKPQKLIVKQDLESLELQID